jgi:hypothetical protein
MVMEKDVSTQTANVIPGFGKKMPQVFSNIANQDNFPDIARESIRDLMLFNNALESERKRLEELQKKGKLIDPLLIQKMTAVKEKYNYAMSGFKAFDDDMTRYALLALADAIGELMRYMHTFRGN